MSSEVEKCELCGEPMPPGETMFKFHGYSGPCPKPPLSKTSKVLVTACGGMLHAYGLPNHRVRIEFAGKELVVLEAAEAALFGGIIEQYARRNNPMFKEYSDVASVPAPKKPTNEN